MKNNHRMQSFISRYKVLFLALSLVVFGIIAVVLLQGGNSSPNSDVANGQSNAPRALQLSFQDYSGTNRDLSSFLQDGPIVVNSWAVWCPFCVKELGDFADAQEQYKGKVTIIAINRAEPLAVAKDFTDELGISQKLVFLQDPDDKFYQTIEGFSMPETIFVARDGTIIEHKRGPLTKEEIIQKLLRLLGDNS
ncbi:MAG: TlpA disulfide reductase family protein [Candidatus Saccharimonadales bacterium]